MPYSIPDPNYEELLPPGQNQIGNVAIDWGNPLTNGLIEYYLCKDYRSLFNRTMTADRSFVTRQIFKSKQCLKLETSGSSSHVVFDPFIPDSSPITLLISLNLGSALASDKRLFLSNANVSAIMLRATSGTTLEILINSLSNDRVSHSVTVNTGEDYVHGGSWGGDGTTIKIITQDETNGVKITANSSASSGTYTNSEHSLNKVSAYDETHFYWMAAWKRQLSDNEVRRFLANQYQFLIPG